MPSQELTDLQLRIQAAMRRVGAASKVAFAPQGSMPAPDPAMAGGAPPMDPAMMGGGAPMPPMDPAMAGGAPPMDPAMMGGAPPMDPAMAGGAPMPPMDPSMMGGMPMDPAAGPTPPGLAPQDPMQIIVDLNDKIDAVGDLLMKICRHLNISLDGDEGEGAESLVNDAELDKVEDAKAEDAQAAEPLSDQAQEAVGDGGFIQQQLKGLAGGM